MASCSLAISAGFELAGRHAAAQVRPRGGSCRPPRARCRRRWWQGTAAASGRRSARAAPARLRVETFCAAERAAVGQPDLDRERVAAIDRRRPRGRRVKLARHQLVQALAGSTPRRWAKCNRSPAARSSSAGSPGRAGRPRAGRIFRVLARVLSLAASQIRRATAGLTRENECMRNCETVGALVSLSMPTSMPSSTP